ncbi:hypothetical protein CJ260_08975 [Megasphaera sp. ASD88]|jgi:hypothetical protein|uniref:hypothetical protein n=1 Tax=Megasphaera TaxID=906 RepID=UPI000820B709|nr:MULTISPECIES: hypothetical protein [Megasphaera]SCI63433.1 Uncharacterised protein [uncultured Ruminococcus sp.]MBM6733220.1 hypothetical protein [Megasphaera stantonii]MCU6713902.1 hypothetical protein [Megasphaera butyrica]PAV38452.1 hypothetical protein CJ260_08975 [Megasphaera sp. ASD88]SCH25841.1 Uncharacterised protein [uncultured Megasphaera sp.]
MSRFKYSSDELDMNKVLKMNQDVSQSMLTDQQISQTRNNADINIEASLTLLRSLGKEREILNLSADIASKGRDRHLEHRPVLESWEEIVDQANLHEPTEVVLEDIMTEDEIQSAFAELDSIEEQFSKKTGIINKTDLSFLAIATALQVVKSLVFPYVADKFDYGKSFDPSERLDHNDRSIEKAHKEANDKFRDKRIEKHGTGHWINILYQTVPYDITKGAKDLGINMGGKYHRMYTLGHDPILGWIFGTANILTDCITFNNFHTNRISRIDPVTGTKKMVITSEVVFLGKMFSECYEEVRADPLNLPAALFAQAQHLKSDEFTKLGLPVPILSSINEDFASKLYSENYDALCFARDVKIVGTSFVISKLFDMIISLLHGLFRKDGEDKNFYEVRSRKILLISNAIASSSSVINAAITSNPKNLDIGSLLNTMTHLFTDIRFILKIKQEFIENEIAERVQKEISVVDALYKII